MTSEKKNESLVQEVAAGWIAGVIVMPIFLAVASRTPLHEQLRDLPQLFIVGGVAVALGASGYMLATWAVVRRQAASRRAGSMRAAAIGGTAAGVAFGSAVIYPAVAALL